MRLARVLDHRQSVPPGNLQDGLCPRADGAFQLFGVQRIGPLVNIDKHRCRAAEADRLRCRHESHWRGDHFIPRSDPQREQSQPERIGSVSDSNGMGCSTKCGEILLEFRHKRTTRKCVAVKNLANGRFEFGAYWLVMSLQI